MTRVLIVRDPARPGAARPEGYDVDEAAGLAEARSRLADFTPDVVVLDALPAREALAFLREHAGSMPIVVADAGRSVADALAALDAGAFSVLAHPASPDALGRALARVRRATQAAQERDALRLQADRQTQEFNALYSIAKTITSLRVIDDILTQVVSAAVNLTRAEEGSLLLVEPGTGALVLRASQPFEQAAAHSLRVAVDDALMSRVVQTRRPVMMAGDDLLRVTPASPVQAVLSVPLSLGQRVIGVLSAAHRRAGRAFGEHDVHLLSTLADYAAIAIDNARLYGAAESERARLDSILRGTPDAVIVTDADLRLLLANEAARAAFHLDEAALGRPLTEVVHSAALLDLFDQGKLRGKTWRAEVKTDDGRTLQGHLSELSGVGFGAALQDISRLKELDRIKSEFISIVSHELRTPLTTIRGYIDLLPRVGPLNDVQREFVQRVERSTNNIVDLIADLLDVSRIEAGLDWEMEPVELHRVVAEAVAALQPAAQEKRLVLHTDIAPMPPILGNVRRLAQAVANLVNNAVRYTLEGGGIQVTLREDGDFALLVVRDTGIGISPQDELRIFDKFYRVGSDDSEAIGGTGLGLSIVKTIVERHKGRVWVDSDVGVGSQFSVLLPRYTG